MYAVERDGLYLAPTAEVPVTNIHRDEILPRARCPSAMPPTPPASGARPGLRARTPGACCGSTSSTRSSS